MSKKPVPALPKALRSTSPKTPSLTLLGTLPSAHASSQTNMVPDPEPANQSPTIDNLKEVSPEYTASANPLASPFSLYQQNLAQARPQAVRWLWQKRLPLAGITLLDGDHGCGKTLLALQIAAHVSSGTPMPDGTPITQGGVVIITPHIDATTTQLQLLTTLGADLSHIEILSFVQDLQNSSHPSGYRPFSLPLDFSRLFESIERVNARLIIFDDFIDLLSHDQRWTSQRLAHLLADLNQHLIERNIACLLVRNCPAKGGYARPSVLERSERFLSIAVSRLLLARDPMQPDRLLLSHALNRHAALTPTLVLQILPLSANSDLPHITIQGFHSLTARDLIENRPNALHRRLLSQHLLRIITAATEPIPVATLYALSPRTSTFQIQRSLSDLLHAGQIQRPTRGFYTLAPATSQLDSTATITPVPELANKLDAAATITPAPELTNKLDAAATITPTPESASSLNTNALNSIAATTLVQTTQTDRTEAYKERKEAIA
jgi:hypothetical protein